METNNNVLSLYNNMKDDRRINFSDKDKTMYLLNSLISHKVFVLDNKEEEELLLLDKLFTILKKKLSDNRLMKMNVYPLSNVIHKIEQEEIDLKYVLDIFMFYAHNEIMNAIMVKRNSYNINKEENDTNTKNK